MGAGALAALGAGLAVDARLGARGLGGVVASSLTVLWFLALCLAEPRFRRAAPPLAPPDEPLLDPRDLPMEDDDR
jgi:hypothetical protein